VSDQVLAACAEFPNDNPGLHRGAIWFCSDVTGAAGFERPAAEPTMAAEPSPDPPTDPTPPVLEADEPTDDIEIVEELAFEDAVDESPEPPALPASDDPFAVLVAAVEDVARLAGADDAAMATLASLLGRARIDPAAPATSHALRAQALAWQGILRGESEDFGACGGSMLDEWCAALVAGLLGQPVRADGLKRELRRRGVAAFGLVEQAA
jgi:hypothetical protein